MKYLLLLILSACTLETSTPLTCPSYGNTSWSDPSCSVPVWSIDLGGVYDTELQWENQCVRVIDSLGPSYKYGIYGECVQSEDVRGYRIGH